MGVCARRVGTVSTSCMAFMLGVQSRQRGYACSALVPTPPLQLGSWDHVACYRCVRCGTGTRPGGCMGDGRVSSVPVRLGSGGCISLATLSAPWLCTPLCLHVPPALGPSSSSLPSSLPGYARWYWWYGPHHVHGSGVWWSACCVRYALAPPPSIGGTSAVVYLLCAWCAYYCIGSSSSA